MKQTDFDNGKITITANSQITQSLPIKILVR